MISLDARDDEPGGACYEGECGHDACAAERRAQAEDDADEWR